MQKWPMLIVLFAAVCAAQQPTADAGVHFTDGGSVSFDANGKMVQTRNTAAYWHGHPGKLYTAAFSQRGSHKATVLVQFQGGLDWVVGGKVTTSSDFAVKSTKTSTAAVTWLPVKSFKVEGKGITVITGDGATLRLYDFDIHFTGTVDRVSDSTKK